MSLSVLIFVNLGRQDAYVWAVENDTPTQFVGKLASGDTLRHLSTGGQKWNVVAGESFDVPASDKNRIYIIGTAGVYEVEHVRALVADSGAIPADFDFPVGGSGGWP